MSYLLLAPLRESKPTLKIALLILKKSILVLKVAFPVLKNPFPILKMAFPVLKMAFPKSKVFIPKTVNRRNCIREIQTGIREGDFENGEAHFENRDTHFENGEAHFENQDALFENREVHFENERGILRQGSFRKPPEGAKFPGGLAPPRRTQDDKEEAAHLTTCKEASPWQGASRIGLSYTAYFSYLSFHTAPQPTWLPGSTPGHDAFVKGTLWKRE